MRLCGDSVSFHLLKKGKRVYLAPIPLGGERGRPLLVFGRLGSGIPLVWGVLGCCGVGGSFWSGVLRVGVELLVGF